MHVMRKVPVIHCAAIDYLRVLRALRGENTPFYPPIGFGLQIVTFQTGEIMHNNHKHNNIQQKTVQAQNVTRPLFWVTMGLQKNYHGMSQWPRDVKYTLHPSNGASRRTGPPKLFQPFQPGSIALLPVEEKEFLK
jgi:hypothetical protein